VIALFIVYLLLQITR